MTMNNTAFYKTIRELVTRYRKNLAERIDLRTQEMQADDTAHFLIYRVLGVSVEEGQKIDLYQNKGRFLYKYAGSFLEEAAKLCLKQKYPESGSRSIQNTEGSRPTQYVVDCVYQDKAIEIKWRDATTDGDHITKERQKITAISKAGLIPIRVMFYYPQRKQAIRIQNVMKDLYRDIPFLNPKAKERAGYPTQKPILLLDRIIKLTTDKSDTVLDPFCGSGTTLVSAKLNERQYLGFDTSTEAVALSEERLKNPSKTESPLLVSGRESYKEADKEILALFYGCEIIPVQRNRGIDAFVKGFFDTGALPVRVQRLNETLPDAAQALYDASISKQSQKMILVKTNETNLFWNNDLPTEIIVIESIGLQIEKVKRSLVRKYEKVS